MRGRKPIPTKLKILRGNPGKRALPENEPEPKKAKKAPGPPKFLDRAAKQEWRRVAPDLYRLGLLTMADMTSLAAYCQAYSRWVQAEAEIMKHGMLVKAPNGYPMQSPLLAVANKAMKQMKEFLVEFGMTPSSRARVTVDKEEKDELDDFLGD